MNLIVGYADDTMIYAVIPIPLSRPQLMELLNQDFAAIYSSCLKWQMRFFKTRLNLWWLAGFGPVLPVVVISLLVVMSLRS